MLKDNKLTSSNLFSPFKPPLLLLPIRVSSTQSLPCPTLLSSVLFSAPLCLPLVWFCSSAWLRHLLVFFTAGVNPVLPLMVSKYILFYSLNGIWTWWKHLVEFPCVSLQGGASCSSHSAPCYKPESRVELGSWRILYCSWIRLLTDLILQQLDEAVAHSQLKVKFDVDQMIRDII